MSVTDRTMMLSPGHTAGRLGVRESTLANWRWNGRGPRYCKVGSRIMYREIDLADWLETQVRQSTSDLGPDV